MSETPSGEPDLQMPPPGNDYYVEALPEPKDLCTIAETMDLLHVSRRTVYNWMAHNKVRWAETPGGMRRIYREDLIRRASMVVI